MPHRDIANKSDRLIIEFLASTLQSHVDRTGDYVTEYPSLSLHRRDAPTDPISCIYGLGLAVTVQGGKKVMLGDKVLDYGPGNSMLTTVDSPMISHITRATQSHPYLALLLKLDPGAIAMLACEMKLPPLRDTCANESVRIDHLDTELLEAFQRLIKQLNSPALLPRLGPLIQQEITIRLLTGPQGLHLRRLCLASPPSEQIAKIVAWMKENFAKSISIDELAVQANMSPSAFRQHFRSITGMSPLRYQKQLRLQEARQLMLNQRIDAGSAAFLVGYESASQFSREYRRQFGAPPQQDVRQVRAS